MSATAPTATPVKGDYKPTAVEVITHEREYRNPFASPEAASAPAVEPAKVETPAAPAAVEVAPKPQDEPAAPVMAQEPAAPKPEIQILPPAEATRPAVRWESPSVSEPRRDPRFGDRDRPDGRPTFRADRREDRFGEPLADGRDPRRDQPQREPRPQFDQRRRPDQPFQAERNPEVPKAAPGGFFGWLKGLFGGKPAETPAVREGGGEPFNDGNRHRRRQRGGRGPGGNTQGYRGERSAQGGERDVQGGPRRRRHRGGRGRGRGGDPRSEGHQGGGAI